MSEQARVRWVWVPVVAVILLAVGVAAVAQPRVGAAVRLRPAATNLRAMSELLARPEVLSHALASNNLSEVLTPDGIRTEDQLPGAVVGLPLAAQLSAANLRPGVGLFDLTKGETAAKVRDQSLTINPEIMGRTAFALADVAVTIEGIEAVARGQYYIHFRYSIWKDSVPRPVRFQLYVEGQARPYLCWIPYVHASGPAHNLRGYVVAILAGETTPLMVAADKVGVAAVDANVQSKGVFTRTCATPSSSATPTSPATTSRTTWLTPPTSKTSCG
jgi:hypothetical protein